MYADYQLWTFRCTCVTIDLDYILEPFLCLPLSMYFTKYRFSLFDFSCHQPHRSPHHGSVGDLGVARVSLGLLEACARSEAGAPARDLAVQEQTAQTAEVGLRYSAALKRASVPSVESPEISKWEETKENFFLQIWKRKFDDETKRKQRNQTKANRNRKCNIFYSSLKLHNVKETLTKPLSTVNYRSATRKPECFSQSMYVQLALASHICLNAHAFPWHWGHSSHLHFPISRSSVYSTHKLPSKNVMPISKIVGAKF